MGDIGYVATGYFPRRNFGVVQGVYPKIGKYDETILIGVVTEEEIPYVVNPDSGYVVSANNLMTTGGCPHAISHAFTFPARVARISEMIENKLENSGTVNANYMMKMQSDVLDI